MSYISECSRELLVEKIHIMRDSFSLYGSFPYSRDEVIEILEEVERRMKTTCVPEFQPDNFNLD